MRYMYSVICDGACGVVELSTQEYERQLDKPNSFWQCPRCGDSAGWNNDSIITADDDDEVDAKFAGFSLENGFTVEDDCDLDD